MKQAREKQSVPVETSGKLPRLPFSRLKDAILGPAYELSVASVSASVSQKLNAHYRGKNNPTNILSFPLTKKSGELILHLPTARKEYKKFGMTYDDFLLYLVIHGMLHLKGMEHGGIMERAERKFGVLFGIEIPNQ